MLVKLNVDEDFAHQLKLVTGTRVASKAFECAGQRYAGLVNQIKQLQLENCRLREVIEGQLSTIHGARDAAALLLERVSQGDIFTN